MRDIVWFDLGEGEGVLELPEQHAPGGPVLELHVVQASDTGSTIAWWETEGGAFLAAAAVGAG